MLDVLVSTGKLEEVSALLNFETHELREARKDVAMPMDAHGAAAAELDGVIQRWQVNAVDAQATTQLIAETRAISILSEATKGQGVDVVAEMSDLMAIWASLLDQDVQVMTQAESNSMPFPYIFPRHLTVRASVLDLQDSGGKMLIHEVHYQLTAESAGDARVVPIFSGFCIEDRMGADAGGGNGTRLREPVRLTAGVVIGLRTTSKNPSFQTQADPRAAYMLVQMLAGHVFPTTGIARSIARMQVVESDFLAAPGSLWDNLVLNAKCRHTGAMPELKNVWELCRRVGISSSVIGDQFGDNLGWETRPFNSSNVPYDDQLRVAIVRALLARPDVLILYRVGSDGSLGYQRKLMEVMRAFLSGELAEFTHAHVTAGSQKNNTKIRSSQTRQSVLFCGSDMVLAHLLDDTDAVLSIDSKSSGTLQPAKTAFPDRKAIMDAWMGT